MSSSQRPRTADEVREAFRSFFSERGHMRVESASLIPHDPTVLFTVAGMVPFKPYFVGDEVAPYSRAVTVQKCARAGGKHNDLDDVGRTKRHLVFFEMLGNFSFGDYFKQDAIPWSWELVTEILGFDGDRLWITVHESDDEAEAIWHEKVGVPMARIQRLGDKDNFWQMGETGPCGPCSEIHIDRGPRFGPEGGPLNDPHGDRFLEFWNLVFMQYNQAPDGSRTLLPRPSIDTGAGLERIVTLMQEKDSVWESDVLFPLVEAAQSATGRTYRAGDYDDRASFSLRVLAEHARSSTMLVNDGVFPSNENRGYVLRRIIRRAVRHAYLLGTEKLVMPDLVSKAIDVMGAAYPDLTRNRDFIVGVLAREEERFRQTLKTGIQILDTELDRSSGRLSGVAAFLLHDTYGFPLELTQEIASERSVEVDLAGFEREMSGQRERAKQARKGGAVSEEKLAAYRTILDDTGLTTFTGYTDYQNIAKITAVSDGDEDGTVEVFLDVTPFYAESGGQVGDTGTLRSDSLELEVIDTTFALPGLRSHLCRPVRGIPRVGEVVTATIDDVRRSRIRRHHTATHVLHWALRTVLGEHVKQAGSLVEPERLRFDFSHFAAVSEEELVEVERLANREVLSNVAVEAYETSKDEATADGAIAFFGDKYGDTVRVLRAGSSFELCGGTHVSATGDIGAIKILGESSIGSNLRRIEAVVGESSVAHMQDQTRTMTRIAELLGGTAEGLENAVVRKIDELRHANDEIKALRARIAGTRAREIAESATADGGVVHRVDGLMPAELRDLAIAVRAIDGVRAVVLAGVTDTGGVALVSATVSGVRGGAGPLIAAAAKAVGGGGGGKGDIASAGGKNPDGIPDALRLAAEAVGAALG
ncbi:MAG: alanine--tRNA ligase [Actinobacteria bacterium]|nr:alanine--tRNA ligase [Actinomycetota bacterium]